MPPYSGWLSTIKEITITSIKDLFYCCVYFTCIHLCHVYFFKKKCIEYMCSHTWCLKCKGFAFIFIIYQTFLNHSSIFENELFFLWDCSYKQYASNPYSVTHLSIDTQMRFEVDSVPRNILKVWGGGRNTIVSPLFCTDKN